MEKNSRYGIQHRKLELIISLVFAPHFLRFLGAIYTSYRAEPAMILPYNYRAKPPAKLGRMAKAMLSI